MEMENARVAGLLVRVRSVELCVVRLDCGTMFEYWSNTVIVVVPKLPA
jgi:hypothetical protein